MAQASDTREYRMRHSLAHILAAAVIKLWPDTKFGVGPVVDNGFYYDVDSRHKISEDDFSNIEKEMAKIIKEDQEFEYFVMTIDEAIKWAKDNSQPYKVELLNDLKRSGTTAVKELDSSELGLESDGDGQSDVSFYRNGNFTDLCRGPHVESTGKVGSFKLMRISGAYWRGDENRAQMQRIYGVAFNTDKELRKYLNMLDEARKRDHRKLGQELDLFTFSPLVGSGLPLFTPRGTILRTQLVSFAEELRKNAGFEQVNIPHITKTDLYRVSGHWDKFGDELFLVKSQETTDELALKPMNCPHHNQIYVSSPKSYRDLPVRYFETTTVYRDEKSGELGGLSRVRSISQDDSHIYATRQQLGEEVEKLIKDIQNLYTTLEMPLKARLSFRDESDVYLGDANLWEVAQNTARDLAIENNLEYFEVEGEAAFYGPKIDFMATDAIGREHQVATVQLDFVQPERFELEYTSADGSQERPVMIHCALLGSIERFLSVYIEHTAGKFPAWLAPEQMRIITVNQEKATVDYANEFTIKAKDQGLRAMLDNSNESVGKKIRQAELMKVPYVVVIGQKEIENGMITPRIRSDICSSKDPSALKAEVLIEKIRDEVKERVNNSTL